MPVAVTGRGRDGPGGAGHGRAPPVAAALAGRVRFVVAPARPGRGQAFSWLLRNLSAAKGSAGNDSGGVVGVTAAEALRGRRRPRPPPPGGGREADGGLWERAVRHISFFLTTRGASAYGYRVYEMRY